MLCLEQSTYLGPARVLQSAEGRVKLELPDELAWAVSALAFPYQPATDDIVLVVGRSGAWYVIGVLKGSATTTLTLPADFEVRAPRGKISLKASQGVEIAGDRIRLTANRLELAAKSVMERFVDVTRWVTKTFQLRAGRMRTRVEGNYDVAAQRIIERADCDVKIDGQKINLG
jgi:hypothetical protein